MSNDRDPRPGEGDGSSEALDRLVLEYVDRLNAGEKLDRAAIERAHPAEAVELLGRLEAFVELGDELRAGGESLGTLGDYTLRRRIGRGGMGVVYEAWENSMDRRVALKVLPPGVAADERALQRFVREAKTAGQLNHPNVVSVYGMGLREQTPYYAMEFVEGETLAQILTRVRDASPGAPTPFGVSREDQEFHLRVARAFADAADGLQHAHARGVIHRDIKPSNLILDREGRLRILDFGLARLEGQESITVSGDVVGTVQYMSPEQAQVRKIPVDQRTDVYSLGATLYEVLTLRPPFKGRDHRDTLSQIIARDAESLRKLNPRIPRDVETIVLKCIRKDPRDRYGTAEALAQDLRRFVRGDPVEARPEGRLERIRRRAWVHRLPLAIAGALVVVCALSLALATVCWRQHRQEQFLLYDRLLLEGIARSQVPTTGGAENAAIVEPFRRFRESAAGSLREATRILPHRPEAWWRLSQVLVSLGEPTEARAALDRALAASPDFVPAMMARLRLEVDTSGSGDLAEQLAGLRLRCVERWQGLLIDVALAEIRADTGAVERLHGALLELGREREPYHGFLFEQLVLRGHARMRTGRALAATQDFLEARWRAPEILSTNLLLAGGDYALECDAEAHAILDETQRRFPDPDARLAIADVALRYHDLDRALAAADDLPGDIRLTTRLEILFSAERYEDAVKAGRAAIASDVHNPTVYAVTAEALSNLKRLDECETLVRQGLQAYPEDRSLNDLFYVSVPYLRCRHEELLRRQLSLPADERAWIVMAWSQYRLGHYEEALRTFQYLIDAGLRRVDTRFGRGWTHCHNGRVDAAVADWVDGALLSSGTHFLTIWSIAKVLDSPSYCDTVHPHWSQIDRALSMPEARRRDDPLWLGLRALARTYGSSPDKDQARRLAERGVELSHGRDGQALSRLADVLYARGEITSAIRTLERARGTRNRPGILEKQLASYRAALGDGIASAASIDDLVARLAMPGVPAFERDRDVLRSRVATNAPPLSGYLEGVLLEYSGDAPAAMERLDAAVLDEGLSESPAIIRLARVYAANGRRDEGLALLERSLHASSEQGLDRWEAWLQIGSRDPGVSFAGMLARLDALESTQDATGNKYGHREDVRIVLSHLNESGAIRINCGGADLVDSRGHTWIGDRFFEGGEDMIRFAPPLEGTNDPLLFTQQRIFWMDFEYAPGYRVPLPAGAYELTLFFVESVVHPVPIRCAIECEGEALDPDFLVNEKGFGVAQQRTFRIRVEDGALDLVLRPKPWLSVLSGIELRLVR
ncbi:MAG TPA: hypothetical protein DCM87_19955 [Planctomycetes bacterium]|nr:hypothetical protein [Planctomycetota bacterium]